MNHVFMSLRPTQDHRDAGVRCALCPEDLWQDELSLPLQDVVSKLRDPTDELSIR